MTIKYLVELQSKPGMYAQYTKQIVVSVNEENEGNEHEIFYKAVQKINRGEFSDRPASMWIMKNYEDLKDD